MLKHVRVFEKSRTCLKKFMYVFFYKKRYLFIGGLPAIENDYNVDEIIIFYTIQYFVMACFISSIQKTYSSLLPLYKVPSHSFLQIRLS